MISSEDFVATGVIYLPDPRNIATGIKIKDAKTGKLITENEEGVWRLMDPESKEASSRCAVSLQLCPGFPNTQMNL